MLDLKIILNYFKSQKFFFFQAYNKNSNKIINPAKRIAKDVNKLDLLSPHSLQENPFARLK